MKKILCIGGVTVDIVVNPVDSLPQSGTLKAVENITTSVGGCAANAAIDLGKLGAPVALSCKVGGDAFGKMVINEAFRNGVKVSGIAVDNGVSTSASVVTVASSGERSFLYSAGSTAKFCASDVDKELLKKCDIVFIASAMLLPMLDGEPMRKLLAKAKKMGKYTVMDTVWDPDDIWLDKVRPALSELDLFMPSYEEAAKITQKSSPEDIAQVLNSLGAKNVIVKMGSKGAYVKPEGKEAFISKAFCLDKPVDTNGAGDAFCAGFLCALAQGWDFERCAQFANAVGRFCVTGRGASSGIRPKEEIENFIKSQEENII